jgi:hypothetical protein
MRVQRINITILATLRQQAASSKQRFEIIEPTSVAIAENPANRSNSLRRPGTIDPKKGF